ncbi:hypothetical protein [Anatilimnocola floriformis]|uniref:hypothetical protein n=1 Tax=Anatilimnocola floriformis TaxID=2948575 RepID=UPI0020C463AE|nr:hypothetical protein [Anatilimnocola floriformis]
MTTSIRNQSLAFGIRLAIELDHEAMLPLANTVRRTKLPQVTMTAAAETQSASRKPLPEFVG